MLKHLLPCVLLFNFFILKAGDTLQINEPIVRLDLKPYSELWIDSSGVLGIEDILEKGVNFEPIFQEMPSSNYPEVYWLHISLRVNYLLHNIRVLLKGDANTGQIQHRLDYMDFYLLDSNEKLLFHGKSGFFVPQSQKNLIAHPLLPVIQFSIDSAGTYDVYIQIRNVHIPQKMSLDFEFRAETVTLPVPNYSNRWGILIGYGMMVVISLYMLVFYFYTKDKAFLYFGIFCALYSFDYISSEPVGGVIFTILESPTLHPIFFHISLFCFPFFLLFGKEFIDVKGHFPKWHTYYLGVLYLFVGIVIYYFIRSFLLPVLIFQWGFIGTLILLIPICIRFLLSNIWTAHFFSIGYFSFIGGNLIGICAIYFGQLWAPYAYLAGQFILLFLLAVGLGRRLLESERAKSEIARVKELNLLKTRFFANISHEFRTPLSLILGPLQKVEESVPFSETESPQNELPIKAGDVAVMKRNAMRLQQLIDQILDLSKLEAGKMQLYLEQGNIIHFIKSRVSEFADVAAARHIHFISNYSPENGNAYFDQDKIEKILVNLLSNAIKYTPPQKQVQVDVNVDSCHLYIEVRDTGQGMTKEEVSQIFNRFYQSDQAIHQGSGIGMALVKDLVDLHKGQISVESQVGEGTRISCMLSTRKQDYRPQDFSPNSLQTSIAPTALLDLQPTAPTAKDDLSYKGFSNKKYLILVVEDNNDLRYYITEILSEDFHVLGAKDGEMGFKLALQHIPDLILTDIMMPNIDGLTFSKSIKENDKTNHIPIILLTAKAEEVDKLKGLEIGVQDYLTKPFHPKELKAKIRNLFELRMQWQQKYANKPWKLVQSNFSSMDEQFLQNVTTNIQENISNEYYSVEALAEEVGYSRSQLFRKLKALMDKSPLEMIKEQRLHYAKQLLMNKSVTVSEAAYKVGYSNVSYFSQSFKKMFDVFPGEVGK